MDSTIIYLIETVKVFVSFNPSFLLLTNTFQSEIQQHANIAKRSVGLLSMCMVVLVLIFLASSNLIVASISKQNPQILLGALQTNLWLSAIFRWALGFMPPSPKLKILQDYVVLNFGVRPLGRAMVPQWKMKRTETKWKILQHKNYVCLINIAQTEDFITSIDYIYYQH